MVPGGGGFGREEIIAEKVNTGDRAARSSEAVIVDCWKDSWEISVGKSTQVILI